MNVSPHDSMNAPTARCPRSLRPPASEPPVAPETWVARSASPVGGGEDLRGEAAEAPGAAEVLGAARRAVVEEHDAVTLRPVVGGVPASLAGVLYRNGPGRHGRGEQDYGHPFDGDGMVSRFSFAGGVVRYANRFVRTRAWREEQRAGAILFRGFGTNVPGGWSRNALRLRFKNASNTNVIFWGGKLLSLWEGGAPHQLDPISLRTRGPHDFGGALRNPSRLGRLVQPELLYAAHPKVDERTGELFGFGLTFGLRPSLWLYRVDARGVMRERRRIGLDRLSFVHDFGLTARHRVFLLPPVSFALERTVLGSRSPVGSLQPSEGPMQALLVPRDGGRPITVPLERGFSFHLAQAFDRPDGKVVVDALVMPTLPALHRFDELLCTPTGFELFGRLTRFVIDPDRGQASSEVLGDEPLEFPAVAPTPTGSEAEVIWGLSAGPHRGAPYMSKVLRRDLRRGRLTERDLFPRLLSEPVYLDDGEAAYLSLVAYDPEHHRSELWLLRADDLSTQAVLPLPHHLPPGLHGSWVPTR